MIPASTMAKKTVTGMGVAYKRLEDNGTLKKLTVEMEGAASLGQNSVVFEVKDDYTASVIISYVEQYGYTAGVFHRSMTRVGVKVSWDGNEG